MPSCKFHDAVLKVPPYFSDETYRTLQASERRAARAMSLERLEREEESEVHDWARS